MKSKSELHIGLFSRQQPQIEAGPMTGVIFLLSLHLISFTLCYSSLVQVLILYYLCILHI